MKQNLQLKIGQNLTLSPQLQQAIKMLGFSQHELETEILLACEQNPLLEVVTPEPEIKSNFSFSHVILKAPKIPAADQAEYDPFANIGEETTLTTHLLAQVNCASLSATDEQIAYILIDAIDERGYLTSSLTDIQQTVKQHEINASLAHITHILHIIQQFEPLGVGARDLQECLLLQLNSLNVHTPHLNVTLDLIKNHYSLLAKENKLINKFGHEQARAMMQLIRSLDPLPGRALASKKRNYIIPDVLVTHHNNKFVLCLNPMCKYNVGINQHYVALLNKSQDKETKDFLADKLNGAKAFTKGLTNRNETLLKVASCIVDKQQDFFLHGKEFMLPMVLADVANTLGLHESTVCRITNQKFLAANCGTFELKYFFSPGITNLAGNKISATVIKNKIKDIIAHEEAPLSDQAICNLLKDYAIAIARRTVTKYREDLGLLPAGQRKFILRG